MAVERLDSIRLTEPLEVGWRRAGDLVEIGQLACDHIAVGGFAYVQGAVHTFAHQIDQPVAFADMDLDVGMA